MKDQDSGEDRWFQAKVALVKIRHDETCKDKPWKVYAKKNGAFITSCKTRMGVDVFLYQVSIGILRAAAESIRPDDKQVKQGKPGMRF